MKAGELGANTFQIFSSSPRMWRYSPVDPQQVRLLQRARERFDLDPLVIHASYLINLGSSDAALQAKSVEAFRTEIERAIAIGANYLVVHPGNYKGCSCVEEGISAVVNGLTQAAKGLKSKTFEILLENTVGAGCSIGGKLQEIAAIGHLASKNIAIPVRYCIDTCHCFCSGYNIATEEGLRDTVRTIDKLLGIDNVRVIHTNDSKTRFDSHVDRHENIGEGHIGIEGFRRVLNHPKLRGKAFILETPVDAEGDDRRNLETLKSLVAKRGRPR